MCPHGSSPQVWDFAPVLSSTILPLLGYMEWSSFLVSHRISFSLDGSMGQTWQMARLAYPAHSTSKNACRCVSVSWGSITFPDPLSLVWFCSASISLSSSFQEWRSSVLTFLCPCLHIVFLSPFPLWHLRALLTRPWSGSQS